MPILSTPAAEPLDRHQRRREQSIPTISVLCGPVGLGVSRWRAWTAGRGAPAVVLSTTDLDAVVAAWVRSLASGRDLVADAIAWLAAFTADGPERIGRGLAARTRHDFEWFWRDLPIPSGRTTAGAFCRLILTKSQGEATPDDMAERLLQAMTDGRLPAGASAVASLADVTAGRLLPALLLTASGERRLEDAARLLSGLVAAVPSFSAGLAAEAADVDRLSRAGPPSHTLDVLREGLVPVESLGEAELADRLRSAGVTAAPASAARRLAEDGASEELAAAFADAARRVGRKDAPEEEDAARSAAERFLFERLESLTATAGRFALNQRLDFRHGPAAAEVDLLAASLRLVIELDGSYFHLRDAAAYRRDRKKDWELQRRGYLVLRFLSDDVVERLEEILDTILAAVELRRTSEPERGRPS